MKRVEGKEMDLAIFEEIQELSAQANEQIYASNYPQAIIVLYDALRKIPKPYYDWEASTWILASIADAYFLDAKYPHQYAYVLPALRECMKCPGAVSNPFIHMRYGQVLLELNELEKAKQELLIAYASEGEELFKEEDPKYLSFVKDAI